MMALMTTWAMAMEAPQKLHTIESERSLRIDLWLCTNLDRKWHWYYIGCFLHNTHSDHAQCLLVCWCPPDSTVVPHLAIVPPLLLSPHLRDLQLAKFLLLTSHRDSIVWTKGMWKMTWCVCDNWLVRLIPYFFVGLSIADDATDVAFCRLCQNIAAALSSRHRTTDADTTIS